jgi:hypothetical protein
VSPSPRDKKVESRKPVDKNKTEKDNVKKQRFRHFRNSMFNGSFKH